MGGSSIGEIYVEIGCKIEGLTSALNSVQKQLNDTKDKTAKWGDKFKTVGKELAVVGAAITATFTAIVLTTAKAGDQFDEMSAKTGISTETLSTLKLAADKSGTSIDSIAAGMKFLATQMLETASATDKSKTVLGALKIAATDASGKLRPMSDVLFDVADKFKGMEAGALKTRLAVAIFGKTGMDMIPILNLGSKGLKENEDAARKLGIEWSGASAKSAAVFADAMIDLKAAGTGLSKTIGEALMPMVQDIIEGMTGAIVKVREWAEKNPELAKTLASVGLALGGILTVFGSILIMLPKLAAGFTVLAAHPVVAAIIALGAALTIAAAAAKIMSDATERQIKMDRDVIAGQSALLDNLAMAAAQCGITGASWLALTEKYHGNISAMAAAVLAGDEGTAMQKALNEEMTKARKASEAQAEATAKLTKESKGLDPALQALLDALDKGKEKTKTMAEKLAELAKETLVTHPAIKKLEDAVLAAAKSGDILASDLKPTVERLIELKVQAGEYVPTALALMAGKLGETLVPVNSLTLSSAGLRLGLYDLGITAAGMGVTLDTTLVPAVRNTAAAWALVAPAIDTTKTTWKDFNEQIVANFIIAIGSILTGQTSIVDGFKALMGSITNMWVNNIAKMVSEGAALGEAIGASSATLAGTIGLIATAYNLVAAAQKAVEELMKRLNAEAKSSFITQTINQYEFLGKISDATAKKILDLTGQFGRAGAEARTLSDMMRDTGVNVDNFDIYLSKATNTLTLMEYGLLDTVEGTAAADEQFGILLEAAKKLGEEGSVAMVNFITTSRQMGLEIASVTKYVDEQLGVVHTGAMSAADGLRAMAAAIAPGSTKLSESNVKLKEDLAKIEQQMKDLAGEDTTAAFNQLYLSWRKNGEAISENEAKIAALKKEQKGLEEGSAAWDVIQGKIINLNAEHAVLLDNQKQYQKDMQTLGVSSEEYKKLEDAAAKLRGEVGANDETLKKYAAESEAALKRVENQTLAVYNAMIANGASVAEATASIGPALDIIIQKHKDLGTEAGPAIEQLLKIRGVTESHKELMSAIDGNDAVLKALGNTGFMTADILNDAASQADDYYNQLIAAGMTSNEALAMMGPTLSDINKYAETYGITLDENSLRMINAAKEAGLIKEEVDMGEEVQTTNKLLGDMRDIFAAIADKLGIVLGKVGDVKDEIGKVPDVIGDWTGAIEDVGKEFKDVKDDISDIGEEVNSVWKDLKDKDWGIDVDVDVNTNTGGGGSEGGSGGGGYATGGIAWHPQLATVAEIQPEIIGNLDDYLAGRPLAGIPQSGSGGATNYINLTINAQTLDDATISRAAEKIDAAIKYQQRRAGRN